jgi:hypothetical protein
MKLENVKPKQLIECDCYGTHYRIYVERVDQEGIHAERFRAMTNGKWHNETHGGGYFHTDGPNQLANIRRAKVKRL